ncbi:ABC transporter ATP-binding protein [Chromobacterium sp. IIBBL 290-4]|uniref:ABC transporter ATP-binding protein n=1 Tax=Chromobacterium sp. IIBBL 290-4 TaxID=2953890 RepID=UPI0020B73244|nr:ABC transporter ATP-binding protein [Chromobacterium sp. IIBBL 290-4]UTH76567.1 ABC transporter ATP-binding protein [Chromobacterium sp. IIBBL 290-4]
MLSNNELIQVSNLGKCYTLYKSASHRFFSLFPILKRKANSKEFWALKSASFTINKGETVGIVGKNGSGKSTLMQLICHTLSPTQGSVVTNGKIAALLELGAGFNPEFTGRENVYLAASLYGLTKKETDNAFQSIIDFSEIHDFIDQPVKTYSSGMFVRLAFSVVAHVKADILIIDEALSVGDAYFVQKCMRFLRQFISNDGTLVFCSHDTGAVTNLCNKAIWVDRGEIRQIGTPKEVTQNYLASLYDQNTQYKSKNINTTATEKEEEDSRDCRESLYENSTLRNDIKVFKFKEEVGYFGAGGAKIINTYFKNSAGEIISTLTGGDSVCLVVECLAERDLLNPIVGFQIKDRLGQVIFADNTYLKYMDTNIEINHNSTFMANFSFRLPILPTGDYSISPAIAEGTQESHIQLNWMHDALIFKVHASSVCLGIIGLDMKNIEIEVI